MDVAIVGIGCRFPGGADSPDALWTLLCEAVDAIGELPSDRFDVDALFDADPAAPGRMYTRWGGFLDRVDAFDADFFGIATREARRIDPQQRLLLEVVWEALEDGGQVPDQLAGSSTGVFVGISTHDYVDVQDLPHNRHRIDGHLNAGIATSIAANRVSYLLDLRGPSLAVDTACSSSLTAVHLACRSLAAGECDTAIAGGVGLLLAPEGTVGFCKASMLSPDGRCRAFDAQANGYVRSEGAGAVVLKPLDRALADGDPIHGVILGSAVNQDGRTTGLSLPSVAGQQELLRRALQDAGVAGADISYVEAHGTGTPAGDPIEAEAIGTVLSTGRGVDDRCLLGSVKTNLGHLEAAAGMAGLIKAVLALEHRQVPPNLHFSEPNPAIAFDQLHLRVPTTLEPWPSGCSRALAGVNSFGFGGANAHVVLAEPPAFGPAAEPRGEEHAHVLTVSARSRPALEALARHHQQRLGTDHRGSLHDVCYTAAVRRTHHRERLAVVGRTGEELSERLQAFLDGQQRPGLAVGHVRPGRGPELAFVFTGMGPQWWGMGRQLLEVEPVFRDTLEEVDGLLRPLAGWSLLAELTAGEDASRVADADVAHVANLAVQVALAALWRCWGIVPDAVVGHSSGEMAAACVAGALSLPDAVRLAFHRGRLQHRTSGTGRMLAAGISPEEAVRTVDGHAHEVAVAAINSPSSVTLSGNGGILERIAQALTAQERFARFLPVEVPYHGPQMEAIRSEFLDAVGDLRPGPANIPLASVVTGGWVDGPALDAGYWWRNIRQPVRFAAAADRLIAAGCELFVEVGPHPVLAPALAECLAAHGRSADVLPSLRRGEDESEVIQGTLAALHVRGRPVRWAGRYARGRCVKLPSYPWQRERHWFDDGEQATTQPSRPTGIDTGHPLLGRRLPGPQPIWETRLDGADTAYLDAHVVQDTTLFPGAGYVETMLAAARDLWGDQPVSVEDIRFRKLLFLHRPRHGAVQVLFHPRDAAIEIHSSPDPDGTSWTLHTTARLDRHAAGDEESLDLAALQARCASRLPVDEHYDGLERRGYRFGEAFRTLREIRLGSGEALARVGFPPGVDLPVDGYRAHPALLDAALQLFGAAGIATADVQADAPFFPVSIRRLRFRHHLTTPAWAYCAINRRSPALIEGDAWLIDESGEVTAAVEGLRLQVLDEQQPSSAVDDWLYELRWEPAPPAPDGAGLLRPAAHVREAVASSGPPEHTAEVARYLDVVEPTLNRVARGFALAALDRMGWTSDTAPPEPVEATAQALGVVPAHRRLFSALLTMARDLPAAEVARTPRDPATLHGLLDGLAAAQPDSSAEAELLRRGGQHLSEVLQGELDAREVLLTGESIDLLTGLYRTSPSFRPHHRLLGEAVAAAVDGIGHARRLQVLEVGAGTGAATDAILPHLPPSTDYVFTDVSRHFLSAAQGRFGARPGLRFELLDLERDPAGQGFDPHSFDLVVAANVVHATADLDRTLAHLRGLLAEDGLLALLELTRHADWLNLVFGLLAGWWRFADSHRSAVGPMLPAPRWRSLLEAGGFRHATALFGDTAPERALQSVLLADAPAPAPAEPVPDRPGRHWLVFADEAGVAAGLRDALRSGGDRCTLVRYDPHGRAHLDRAQVDGSVVLPAVDTEAHRRLLEEISSGGAVDGIVHLWSLDASPGEPADATALLDAQQLSCGSVLSLVQALAGTPGGMPDLWLVTAGAQAVPGHDGVPNVGQSPLWGLGRVLLSEQAGTRCRLVDVSPDLPTAEVAALAAEVTGDGADEEVALRGDRRFVRRLRRTAMAELPRRDDQHLLVPADDGFRLEVDRPGSLDSLVLREAPLPVPAAGEVSIRVRASGLNFRDVLQALDMLPAAAYREDADPGALGIECAGVVVACGEGVHQFRPGEEVIALAAAAHGSRVVAREHLTVAKPPSLSFTEAASVLNAFTTAEHALHEVARIAAGERVLVHSATGAVGLAAIQLCRRAGAEVFATAGTGEKRAYLRDLGIEHVMDSRSLAFAEEVLEATGGEGVDVVLNSLSGAAMGKGLSVLRPYGRFVELGKRDIFADARIGLQPFRRNLSFHAVDLIQLALDRPPYVRGLVERVVQRVADGSLQAVPTTAFDLAQADQAFRLMAQARHIGKVVLTVDQPTYQVRSRAEAPLFDRNATYLVTGGLGGFGLAVAEWMADQGAGSLVLMSRTGRPEDNGAALERLRAGPALITVAQGDVSREPDLRRVLDRIRRDLPRLKGVVHAAMVLDDDVLVRLDQQRFRAVLAPKVAGGWNLHRLTDGDDLDCFVLFSSFAAVVGHPMQGNYAAANAFLDALVAHRQARGLPALTVGWGVVNEVGYVSRHPELHDHLERGGFRGLSPRQALDTLGQLMRRDVGHVVAASMDWRRWADLNSLAGGSNRFRELVTEAAEARPGPGSHGAEDPLALLHEAVPANRQQVLAGYVAGKVAHVLGTTPEKVDHDRPLPALGFDSLMAVELTTTFANDLGVRLPVVEVLQGASSVDLAQRLLGELGGEPAGPQTDPDVGGPDATAAADADHPLSSEQRRFWFLQRLDPQGAAYNLPVAARLSGRLQRDALQRSLSEVLRRHPVLRAAVREVDGQPVQRFASPAPADLPLVDLSDLPERQREQRLAALTTQAVRRPFDLGAGILLRAALFRLAADQHVLLLVVHHIACDAWAMNLVVREIAALYEAFSEGQPSPLPEPSSGYLDYVAHQQQRRAEVEDVQLDYWRHQLADAPSALRLPGPPVRPETGTTHGAHHPFELTAELTAGLQALAGREGVTLFMALLAGFQTLLHRYCAADDVCVGTAVSTRDEPGVETVVGCFLNTLVLRSDLSGDPTFRELLQRVKKTTLEAYRHQDVPFERVVQAVRPERGRGRNPLFEAMLVLHNARWPELQVAGLDLQPVAVESGTAVADLVLLVDMGQRLGGMVECNADRFDAATIDRMLGHLRTLLEAVVADPQQRLSALPILPDAERHQVLVDWSQTAAEPPAPECLHQLVEAQVGRSPQALAVVSEGTTLTYAELDERADRLAAHLPRLGVGSEAVVGVCLPRSPALVVASLAVLKAGGAYLPLDPSLPPGRLRFLLADAQPAVLLTWEGLRDRVAGTAPVVTVDADGAVTADGSDGTGRVHTAGQAVDTPANGPTGDSLAYVIYTSGSTGEPKGVMVPHRAICNQVRWRQQAFPLSEADAVLQRTPLGFDPSIWELFGPLAAGARLVLPPPGGERDGSQLVRLLAEEQITTLQVVPSALEALLEQPGIDDCRDLRLVLCGGEPLPTDLAQRFLTRLQAELHNLYGPSESTIDATHRACRRGEEHPVVPIGRPIDNVRIRILDAGLQPVPVGVPGELHIGGAGLARGYRNRPDLTAERFIQDPFLPGERLYRTGDVGRWLPDGTIAFAGRVDRQVKVRGFRVEPAEIEAVLTSHPAVGEAAVVPIDQPQAAPPLAAFVAADESVTATDLQGFVAERLPGHMVPARVTLLEALPRTANGKVDLIGLAAQQAPAPPRAGPPVASRDPVEEELLRIWEGFFPGSQVGVTDDFFALGGHSLLAMRLLAQVERAFGRQLPVSSLVQHRSIERFARLLREPVPPGSPLVAIQPHGRERPQFWIHPLSGTVYCYAELAAALGRCRPFYALEAVGLSGQPAHTRIEDMARHYVEQLKGVQEAGPYLLGGWSMGGLIAYEMARQLRQGGERVALLTVVDAVPAALPAESGQPEHREALGSFMEDLGLSVDDLPVSAGEFWRLSTDDQLDWVLSHARRAQLLPADLQISGMQRRLQVFTANLRAMRRYAPMPYTGRLTVLDAEGSLVAASDKRRWEDLVDGDVMRYTVAGDHHTVMRRPHVAALARRVSACLEEAELVTP